MRHAYRDSSYATLCGDSFEREGDEASVDCPKCLELIKARKGEVGVCHQNALDYLPCLHLYAQEGNHMEAWVVGTLDGLKALRDALNRVIETNEPTAVYATVSDGEGYGLLVVPKTEREMEELKAPYTHPFGDYNPGKSPFESVGVDIYRDLLKPNAS